MQASDSSSRQIIQQFSATIPAMILFVTFLSIPLSGAELMNLSASQTASWIFVVYGLAGILAIVLSFLYRQPFLMTGNIFILIFVSSPGQDIAYSDLVGASILAGIIVLGLTVTGLLERVTAIIPPPIIFGLLAGAIMPLITGIFTSLVEAPVIVGSTFLAYIIGRMVLGKRLPATVPALIVGLLTIAVTAQFGQLPAGFALPGLTVISPTFSLNVIATITPIFVVLVSLQANIPSMIFMQTQDFEPPQRTIHLTGGIASVIGSFLGPVGFSLSLPLTSMIASPLAGEHHLRHRAAYFAGAVSILIALLAGVAITLPDIVPLAFLLALAGLSLIDVFANAVQAISRGPLRLGPLFTFVISVSQITFLGFGAFFWGLVVGTIVTFLLEEKELKQWRETTD